MQQLDDNWLHDKKLQTVPALHPMALQLAAALVGNDEIDVFTAQVRRAVLSASYSIVTIAYSRIVAGGRS